MDLNKKEKRLRGKLTKKLLKLKLPPFLLEEICKIMKLLDYYKLKNLEKNRNHFETFLKRLNKDYEIQIIKNI